MDVKADPNCNPDGFWLFSWYQFPCGPTRHCNKYSCRFYLWNLSWYWSNTFPLLMGCSNVQVSCCHFSIHCLLCNEHQYLHWNRSIGTFFIKDRTVPVKKWGMPQLKVNDEIMHLQTCINHLDVLNHWNWCQIPQYNHFKSTSPNVCSSSILYNEWKKLKLSCFVPWIAFPYGVTR